MFTYDDENLIKIYAGVVACSQNNNKLSNYEKYIGSYLAVKISGLKEPENLADQFISKAQKQVPNAKELIVITYGRLPIRRSYFSIAKFFIETNPEAKDFNFSKSEISYTNMFGKFHVYFKETTPNTLVLTSILHPDGSLITDGDAISILLSGMPE